MGYRPVVGHQTLTLGTLVRIQLSQPILKYEVLLMKYNPNKGYRNDWIDLCMDGLSSKRRIKGKDKKMMQRLTKKRLNLELRSEISSVS